MLFACSGVALQHKGTEFPVVSRFVTSKRLVTEFEVNRNRADKLRVASASRRVSVVALLFNLKNAIVLWAYVLYYSFHCRLLCAFPTKNVSMGSWDYMIAMLLLSRASASQVSFL